MTNGVGKHHDDEVDWNDKQDARTEPVDAVADSAEQSEPERSDVKTSAGTASS